MGQYVYSSTCAYIYFAGYRNASHYWIGCIPFLYGLHSEETVRATFLSHADDGIDSDLSGNFQPGFGIAYVHYGRYGSSDLVVL